MKKEKILKFKYFIPAIIVMIMIFYFSSEPKNITNEKSDSVIRVIKDFVPFIKNSIRGSALVFIVRKCIHAIGLKYKKINIALCSYFSK